MDMYGQIKQKVATYPLETDSAPTIPDVTVQGKPVRKGDSLFATSGFELIVEDRSGDYLVDSLGTHIKITELTWRRPCI